MADETAKIVRKAEKLVRKGKAEAAIKEYRKVLAGEPDNINILNRVGDLHVDLKQYEDGVKIFAQVAEHYVLEGFHVKAIALYKKILRILPDSLIAHQRLAELYAEQKLTGDSLSHYKVIVEHWTAKEDFDQTAKVYEKMVAVDPETPELRLELAELYENAERNQDAARVYVELAQLLTERGWNDQAAEIRSLAAGLDPESIPKELREDAERHYNDLLTEARVFAKYGLSEKTRGRVEEVLSKAPEHPDALALLQELDSGSLDHLSPEATLDSPQMARILEELQRLEEELSIGSSDDVPSKPRAPLGRVPLDTDEIPTVVGLADADDAFDIGAFADNLDDTAMGWLDEPEESLIRITLGEASGEAPVPAPEDDPPTAAHKRHRRADEILRTMAVGTIPSDPTQQEYDIHLNLGIAYREMGLHEEACKELEIAVEDPRHLVEASLALGASSRDLGLLDDAVNWYRKGLEAPDLGEIKSLALLYNLGESYLAMDQIPDAVGAFEKIEGVRKDYRDVADKLLALRGT